MKISEGIICTFVPLISRTNSYNLMKPIKTELFLFLLFISVSYAISYAYKKNQSFFLHTIEKGQSLYLFQDVQCHNKRHHPFESRMDEKIYAGQTIKFLKEKKARKGKHSIRFKPEKLYTNWLPFIMYPLKQFVEANGLSAENFRIGQVILIPLEKKKQSMQTLAEKPLLIQGPVLFQM